MGAIQKNTINSTNNKNKVVDFCFLEAEWLALDSNGGFSCKAGSTVRIIKPDGTSYILVKTSDTIHTIDSFLPDGLIEIISGNITYINKRNQEQNEIIQIDKDIPTNHIVTETSTDTKNGKKFTYTDSLDNVILADFEAELSMIGGFFIFSVIDKLTNDYYVFSFNPSGFILTKNDKQVNINLDALTNNRTMTMPDHSGIWAVIDDFNTASDATYSSQKIASLITPTYITGVTTSANLDWLADNVSIVLSADVTVTNIINSPAVTGSIFIKVTGNYKLRFNMTTVIEEGRQIKGATNFATISKYQDGTYLVTWFNASEKNRGTYFLEEMIGVTATNAGQLMCVSTGGYVSEGVAGSDDRIGIAELHTTNATSKIYIGTSVKAFQLFSRTYDTTIWLKTPSVLSDASNTYQLLAGFLYANNALSQQYGAYFKYDFDGTTKADTDDNLPASVTWKMVNSKNTTIANKTYTDSGVSVVANTWYKLRIIMEASKVLFYINDVLKLTYTGANIPTGSFNYFGCGVLESKTVGTTDRTTSVDNIELRIL